MLKKIILGLIFVVALILGLAATKPDNAHYERSLTMKAPPEKIFPFIQDFHQWPQWSPWEKVDPKMKRTYSGAENGKGAIYEWEGNDDVGSGRMEILEATPHSLVHIKLDFIKPFEGHNIADFTLAPDGDGTKVTWTMDGPQPFMGKVFCLFMNMDKMIGTQFETGLNNLKAASEK